MTHPSVAWIILTCVIAVAAAGHDWERRRPGWWVHLLLGPGCVFATWLTGCPLFLLPVPGWVIELAGRAIAYHARGGY